VNAVIDEKAFDNITKYISKAKKDKKAKILIGGNYSKTKGYFIEPTVIETSDPKYTTMCEEIFGPVLTIYTYPAAKFEKTLDILEKLGQQYQMPYWVNQNKNLPRNYKKCHQMFHFPVFCADGKIYVCCENKGNPDFELGSWDTGDFREIWLDDHHHNIYKKTNVALCQPCRPNITNIGIQNILNQPKQIETLFL
jgi:hypothetical protein